ncbi:MAG TPA: TIGR04282 family arsenosugar biosynthesis glycosyltransferase [Thermoanaerobaculia bacterium]|nr:TIGR04282 family arsenosugar biosynthesis glycosyltransferase [Thermoanaerobaculia bacterium]
MSQRIVLVYTKPAVPGRVKTRLIGALSAEEAADLHTALLGDVLAALAGGSFELRIAWAARPGEPLPELGIPASLQPEGDLGQRLWAGLAAAARDGAAVAAVGSDHPGLSAARVEDAFARLETGADVVLGPAEDGGYYLVASSAAALHPDLFRGIPWSTEGVLAATLERCAARGLAVALLERGTDVDTPADLERLAERLAAGELEAPRTRAQLEAWGRLPLGVSP